MERKCKMTKTQIRRTATEKAESLEEQLRRLSANKQPIPENVPPIYTPKKDGVNKGYDPRADRFEVAIEASDKFNASEIAASQNIGDFGEDLSETAKENIDNLE